MNAIIGALVSVLGSYVSDGDFFKIFTIVEIALGIYEFWKEKH